MWSTGFRKPTAAAIHLRAARASNFTRNQDIILKSISYHTTAFQQQDDPVGPSKILASGDVEPAKLTSHMEEMTPETRILAEKLLQGNNKSLSRAITLCESTLSTDRAQASSLLQHVLMATESRDHHKPLFRIGLTGPPGSGKSSLIEVLGRLATSKGEKVAVLAIDPSSERSGGSILGDKTRMELLSQDPNAFVRPTPARGHLGGIARHTADAALLCEAGGYNVLMIETVGGGQNDIAVAELVDCLLLILPPAAGDELQGIKKGVVEVADIVVINKADGDMERAARRSVVEYKNALHFGGMRYKSWSPPVLSCSAKMGNGVDIVWAKVCEFERIMAVSGALQQKRAEQSRQLFWSNIKNEITERLRTDDYLRKIIVGVEEQVMQGKMASRAAAYLIANDFLVRGS
ncbi:hypothetical protein R1sor_001307 [Riccia sorocarpa]|uniref:AAA+ ATPase domain-containing protein n=1 Tax=Riccia sorocarpa TaxID=122646 RepID=A0ABD3GYQ3_9MARC